MKPASKPSSRTLKLQRQHKLAIENKHGGAALQTTVVAKLGIVGLRDSNFKYEYTLLFLRDVAAAVHQGEFSARHLRALQMLYGPHPTVAAGAMIGFYQDCLKAAAEGKPADEAVADELHRNLKAEIECFETLRELYYSMEISVPPSLLDSRLLLSNKDSKKLNRYEVTIAHQFYNALDRFMEYRRYRLTLGGSTEQTIVNVEASSGGKGDPAASAGGESATQGQEGATDDSKAASNCGTPGEDMTHGQDARATSGAEAEDRQAASEKQE